MILSDEDIDKAILAGKIAGKAITYGKSLVKPDARIVEILDQIEQFISNNGGGIAFPCQMAINEIAAHSCPLADDPATIKETDMVKLDLGVHIDGFIADNAVTISFSEDEDAKKIKQASEEALKNALSIIRPGITLGEVGLLIQETIAKYDLSPIKNLSGH